MASFVNTTKGLLAPSPDLEHSPFVLVESVMMPSSNLVLIEYSSFCPPVILLAARAQTVSLHATPLSHFSTSGDITVTPITRCGDAAVARCRCVNLGGVRNIVQRLTKTTDAVERSLSPSVTGWTKLEFILRLTAQTGTTTADSVQSLLVCRCISVCC